MTGGRIRSRWMKSSESSFKLGTRSLGVLYASLNGRVVTQEWWNRQFLLLSQNEREQRRLKQDWQMTSPRRDFVTQLENFRQEANVAAVYVYSDMTVQHAASRSKKLLACLNRTPDFWRAHAAASQTGAYICLGRVFDTKSKFNVNALIDSFEVNLGMFSRAALEARKRDAFLPQDSWRLSGYLNEAHYPSDADVRYLRSRVAAYRAIYVRAFQPARHKYLAHREKHTREEVSEVFGRGTVRDIWRTVVFLQALYLALSEQWMNGRRPVIRIRKYSIASLYGATDRSNTPAARIVAETKALMKELATLSPTPSIERTAKSTLRVLSPAAHAKR